MENEHGGRGGECGKWAMRKKDENKQRKVKMRYMNMQNKCNMQKKCPPLKLKGLHTEQRD